ncbi:dTMP kinase [Aureibacillus halotolerans]|uniref:Thymidylate kinase n=1 Tax=Aureibacillus halotolerans TaxID=1508390 RepID=A0A4R6TXL9_9BACI|nr:dTMP kinase [Aureibacillus halotolerans]TDQ36615.1 dTMP kinase [Aureibacillus halotolerans]
MFSDLRENHPNVPGKLITFCGVDGSGKSTMIEKLAAYLRAKGHDVVVTMQPTPEMRELAIFKTFIYEPEKRDQIDYRALQLYMLADRLQHSKEVIEPALAKGAYVVCDRYIFTMLSTLLTRGHRPEPWMNEIISYILRPDAAFIMDVDLKSSIQRIKQRRSFEDSYVERDHLKKSLHAYRDVGKMFKAHMLNSSSLPIEEASHQVFSIVDEL